MSIQYTLTEQVQGSGISAVKQQTKSGNAHTQVIKSVADSETDYEIAFELDVSEIEFLYINSTQDVTFETNDGAAPDNSISLLANQPYTWYNGSYDDCLLDTDVTALFITNASGSAATVNVWALYDSTPA